MDFDDRINQLARSANEIEGMLNVLGPVIYELVSIFNLNDTLQIKSN
jgi:hypothetical protein